MAILKKAPLQKELINFLKRIKKEEDFALEKANDLNGAIAVIEKSTRKFESKKVDEFVNLVFDENPSLLENPVIAELRNRFQTDVLKISKSNGSEIKPSRKTK